MRLNKFLPVLIGLSLICVTLGGCRDKNAYAPPPPATVTVSKPVVKDTTHYLYKTGRFTANQEVAVTARVSGVLEQRLFEEGQMVKEGDLLFIIEQTQYKAALEEAQAALKSAYAQNKEAKALLDRRKAAFKTNAISEIEVIQAEASYDQTLANIQNAKALVAVAELNYSYTEVKAPNSGRISRSIVDLGNLVGPNTSNVLLTTIVDDSELKIYFSVTETELAVYISENTPRADQFSEENASRFHINAGLGQGNGSKSAFPFTGVIDFVDNTVDPKTGTILLRGKFDNPDKKIVAGMYARIRLPQRVMEKALTVPEVALGQSQAGYYLYTVDEQNIAHMKNIKVLFIQEGTAVIADGLQPDDTIVINGLSLIQDGRPVNPVKEEAPPAEPAGQPDTESAEPTDDNQSQPAPQNDEAQ